MKNICITGKRGSSKSNIINLVLLLYKGRVDGFRSIRHFNALHELTGFSIAPIINSTVHIESSLPIARFVPETKIYKENFETFANKYAIYSNSELAIMDEIGRFEEGCENFLSTIEKTFNDEKTKVLAVLKKEDLPFNKKLAERPDTLLIDMDKTDFRSAVNIILDELEISAEIEGLLILMAAGTSSRFEKGNKLLYSVDSKPMYKNSVELAESLTKVENTVLPLIITNEEEIFYNSQAQGLLAIRNPQAETGQASTVKAGLKFGNSSDIFNIQFAVFMTCDQPFMSTAAFLGFMSKANCRDFLCMSSDKRMGNPVSFNKKYFPELMELEGDQGGKAVMKKYPDYVTYYLVNDSNLRDIDRLQDLP